MATKLLLLLIFLRGAGQTEADAPCPLPSFLTSCSSYSEKDFGASFALRGGGNNKRENAEGHWREKLRIDEVNEEQWSEILKDHRDAEDINESDLAEIYNQMQEDEDDENDYARTPSEDIFQEVVQYSIDEDIPRLRSSLQYYHEHLPNVLAKLRPITPLMFAAKHGKSVSVRVLLEHGSNASQAGPGDMNAFHIAACGGFTPICRMLLNTNPKLLESCDGYGARAVHYAADEGQLDVLKWLHSMNANLSSEGPNRVTPLQLARDRNMTDSCKFLLEACCLDSMPPASRIHIPESIYLEDKLAYQYDDLILDDEISDGVEDYAISEMGLNTASKLSFHGSIDGNESCKSKPDQQRQEQVPPSRKRSRSMARESNESEEDEDLISVANNETAKTKQEGSEMPFQEVNEMKAHKQFALEMEEANRLGAFEDMKSEEYNELLNRL